MSDSAPSATVTWPRLDPYVYAQDWCTVSSQEPGPCKKGVKDAQTALLDLGPTFTPDALKTVIDKCSQDTTQPEGYRYGCYLATLFNATTQPKGYCDIGLKTQATDKDLPVALPCADSCKALFASDAQVSACVNTAQQQFNNLVQSTSGQCTEPTFSCVYALGDASADRNQVLPQVVGCTLGSMQSVALQQLQTYQKSVGVSPLSCTQLLYPDSAASTQRAPSPSAAGDAWNPFPDGSTYGSLNSLNKPNTHPFPVRK